MYDVLPNFCCKRCGHKQCGNVLFSIDKPFKELKIEIDPIKEPCKQHYRVRLLWNGACKKDTVISPENSPLGMHVCEKYRRDGDPLATFAVGIVELVGFTFKPCVDKNKK